MKRTVLRILATCYIILVWTAFVLDNERPAGGAPVAVIILTSFGICGYISGLISACLDRKKLSTVLLTLIFCVAFTLGTFSYFYWSYGTPSNFGVSLTHLDAFYFAMGTLSTAGTGTINASSELARGLQTAQTGLDSVLVLFAIGLVVARFTSADN